MSNKKEMVSLFISKEELSTYCYRPQAESLSDADMHNLSVLVANAVMENNFWDICRIVLDEYLEGKSK